MKLYKVGGLVRDQFLGIKSKDVDYSVEAESYQAMINELTKLGAEIILQKPEFVTLKAKFKGDVADFVLCRKDGFYRDGRRPDTVEIGTIYDDLARRDFTMNAIAIDMDTQEYLDPFNGIEAIKGRYITCVGSSERLLEDSLRMLRALRFSVTKGFDIDHKIIDCIMHNYELLKNVSKERIYEELRAMLEFNTPAAFNIMNRLKGPFDFIFNECGVQLTAKQLTK